MKKATTHYIDTLRAHGFRVTRPRKQVIAALLNASQPQTIQSLVALVAADEASVYRTIEALQKAGLVEEISIAGERPRFALAHGHHHHLVCTSCGRIAHIPCEEVPLPRMLPDTFSSIDTHELTFHGCCKNCD